MGDLVVGDGVGVETEQEPMRKAHGQLVERAQRAIEDVFSDTSVDRQTTRESLEELLEAIEMRLEALD